MLLLYFLLGIAFIFVLRAAAKLVGKGKRARAGCVLPPTTACEINGFVRAFRVRRSEVRWISMREFKGLLKQPEDVLFVDLRVANRGGQPLPFRSPGLVLLTPSELIGVLRWAPSGNTIVLYGRDDFCSSLANEVHKTVGGTPLYLLNEALDDRGAA